MSDSHFLRPQPFWENLRFYQKADVLYQLTYAFTRRYLTHGDRTIDQMVQAARSGKQNIVEGSADGVTSTEMEIRLLNVARASIKELREDYEDYLNTRSLRWNSSHPRYGAMIEYTKTHNKASDYARYISEGTDEEMANLALTLSHQVDVMMTKYLQHLEKKFVEEGGIKERMTAARIGRRQTQNETIATQAGEITSLKARIQQLENELKRYKVAETLGESPNP